MWGTIRKLWTRTDGAVAPTVALSMVGLIAAGGLAFDYARLVTMDTELQQAADQAALAAATQLDRSDNAITNATAAVSVNGTNQLALNLTRFSNDAAGRSVSVTLTFCEEFDDSQASNADACIETTDPNESRFVIVSTALRTARYAFTPIIGLMSGTARASAVAGVESSICNVAPLFVCTGDASFPDDDDIGKGLLLKTGAQNSWAPGNYGFLDFGPGNPGVIDALLGHGLNGCLPTNETNTQPGNKNATDAINTRLDVYGGNPATDNPNICNVATGAGCPAPSARKDMVVRLTVEAKNATAPPTAATCPADPKAGGYEFELPASPVVGFDRDDCHPNGCAGGNFGDGIWNYAGYMAANHPTVDPTTVPKAGNTPTRYEVYKWELLDKDARMAPKTHVTQTASEPDKQGRRDYVVTTQCTYSKPMYGRTDYPAQKDRRILPVIAADCTGLNGVGNADEDFYLLRVFDVFITEPSGQRSYPDVTDDKEIYGEVIGPAETFEGGSGIQYYARARPYLVR